MQQSEVSKQVFIKNEFGLHSRPAAQLAQEAAKFHSSIKLVLDNTEVDAKSVLDILTLAATKGRLLTLQATGEDAEEAVSHLERIFCEGFGEK